MKKLISIAVILFAIMLYTLTLRGSLGNPSIKQIDTTLKEYSQPFESSHERSPFALIMSLDRDKKFDLSRDLADIGAPDVSYHDGKFYSFFPIGLPLLLYPSYELGKITLGTQIMTFGTIALFAVISVYLVFLITKNIFKVKSHFAILAALIFGFGTTSWSYAITIYQHIPSTMLFLLMFYSGWKHKVQKKTSIVWASLIWISYGILIAMDYPNAIMGLPLMIYFFLNSFSVPKTTSKTSTPVRFSLLIVVSSIFFIGLIGSHLYFNYKQYGGPTLIPQSFDRYERDKYYQLLGSIKAREQKQKISVVTKKTDSTLEESRSIIGSYILLFDNDKGIFFYSPILIIALLGYWTLFKKQKTREAYVLLLMAVVNLFVYSSFGDPWGGWAYGPRYLIPAMAFLSIAVVIGLDSIQKKIQYYITAFITFIFFAYSSGVALLGALTTNIIPPKVEAIPLKLKYYNYFQNFDYLKNGYTSNYIYNAYLRSSISLYAYFFIIWGILLTIALILLFIVPMFKKNHESDN